MVMKILNFQVEQERIDIHTYFLIMAPLSSARRHGKHTYLSGLGMLGKKRNYFPLLSVTLKFKFK